jgi:hypothetical protein
MVQIICTDTGARRNRFSQPRQTAAFGHRFVERPGRLRGLRLARVFAALRC